ncbi:esterase-like activity of phytase family protein [Mesorhizobium sp. CAU 1732]|uniref:esterase-like activity of phytase family protein n=1 Tax=Mesorhizobium sp. CAU 1732 TaxID=3140358 RepID=UPI0032600125
MPVLAQNAAIRDVDVQSSPIPNFRLGSSDTVFGALEFVGGLTMRSSDREFGQVSGLRFLTPGEEFLGVADHGYFVFGTIARDAAMVPIGVERVRIHPIAGEGGRIIYDKEGKDAEGLSVHDGIATVAFERLARVEQFRIDPKDMKGPIDSLDFIIPPAELRYNQGLETIARAPDDSPLAGATVVVAERSVDGSGNIFAAILDGPQKGIFKVVRSEDFDVTDGAFLPNGDLLLLERRLSVTRGVGIRIRRFDGANIVSGALIDGDVVLEADLAYQIDNMEAMDVWKRADGATMISLMSDDNQSFLQRSLYLEFRLVE